MKDAALVMTAPIPILMYHQVDAPPPKGTPMRGLVVSPAAFARQMAMLRALGFTGLSMQHLLPYLTGHKKGRVFGITFDDGYENNYTLAYPIFKALEIPFTIFTVNSFINKNTKHDQTEQAFLNEDQILEMVNLVDFAHHGLKHDNLMDLSAEKRAIEISESVKQMEAFKHKTLKAWAYTYGAYPKRNKLEFDSLKLAFKNSGISCAFRIGNRINKLPINDPFKIERIDVRGNESFFKFKLKVSFGKII